MKVQEGMVEGYRLYSILKGKKDDYLLGSLSGVIIAPRRINKAKHIGASLYNRKEICPHTKTLYDYPRCGFNMFKYSPYLDSNILEPMYNGYLIGKGWGWGKVVPGEKGFRCQYFYPKSIFGILATSYYKSNTILQINNDLPLVYHGGSSNMYTLSDNPDGLKVVEDQDPLALLWKIARLYKITLEFELPEWANNLKEDN